MFWTSLLLKFNCCMFNRLNKKRIHITQKCFSLATKISWNPVPRIFKFSVPTFFSYLFTRYRQAHVKNKLCAITQHLASRFSPYFCSSCQTHYSHTFPGIICNVTREVIEFYVKTNKIFFRILPQFTPKKN